MPGLLGIFLISAAVSAQRQSDAAGLRATLSHINDGVVVRVRVAAGPVLSGRYAGIVGDTMVLGPSGAATRLSTASLDSVWTRHRPVVSKGIQGVLLGALLGGLWELAATLNASCHSTSLSSSRFPYPPEPPVTRCRGATRNGRLADSCRPSCRATCPPWTHAACPPSTPMRREVERVPR